MKHQEFWTKVWTLHVSMEPGGDVIPTGGKFWLQPVSLDEEIVYYKLCFEQGLGECLQGMKLYPVGVTHMKLDQLPPWDGTPAVAAKYRQQALDVRSSGRAYPKFRRLEGVFQRDTDGGQENLIARIYCLAQGELNGHDWFVFDIILCPNEEAIPKNMHPKEDGVAHGDN
jgi:hypothetical protein